MAMTKLMTAEELFALPDDGWRYELIDGQPRKVPVGGLEHGWIGARFIRHLGTFVDRHRLGIVVGPDTLFRFSRDPDQGLIPDVAFLRAERLPPRDQWRRVAEIAPDLVVEVVSPNDDASEIADKVAFYLAHGVPLVWITYPARRQVVVHRTGRAPQVLGVADILDGEEFLPGFHLAISELFV